MWVSKFSVAAFLLTVCILVNCTKQRQENERINESESKAESKRYDWTYRLFGKGNRDKKVCKPGAQNYPSKNDRIAIIGAGPAGVHMAYKLQEIGYTDITIFERRNRVGGKSYTYHHKGTRHEMGTVYTTIEYTEITKLLEEFQTGRNISSGEITRWADPNRSFLYDYSLYVIATEYGITDTQQAMAFLLNAFGKYVALHRRYFSTYEGDLFPRPSNDVLEETKGTFMEFLERKNITVLKSIFISSQTIQGYGHLDEIPALYGLMWNTPAFILSILQTRGTVTGVVDTGFQPLWEEIVRRERIKVIFNAKISSIRRSNGKVKIKYRLDNGKCSTEQKNGEFDFLMISGNLKKLFQDTVRDSSNKERRIFDKITHTYFTTSIIDSSYGRRGSTPVNYLLYQAYSKRDFVVQATMDSFGVLNNLKGQNYTDGIYPGNPDGELIQTAVYYQLGYNRPTTQQLDDELANFASTFGISNYNVIKRKTWDYFPRFADKDLSSGILVVDTGFQPLWARDSSPCL